VGRQGIVCAVDCDSYQFKSKTGIQFHCGVGVPEFTAPQLLTATSSVVADRFSTAWSLMVLVHQLIRDGEHPFNSRNTQPPLVDRIIQGLWPDSGKFVNYPPPQGVRPLADYPPEFQLLCHRTFGDGHANPSARPSLNEIVNTLGKLQGVQREISRSAWRQQLPQLNRPRNKHRWPRLTAGKIAIAGAIGGSLAAALLMAAAREQVPIAPPLDPALLEVRGNDLPTPRLWRELRRPWQKD
jgi:DNA-binding helix-hairpin-helix protein with protein kinase domain